jgi:hypothetical protein
MITPTVTLEYIKDLYVNSSQEADWRIANDLVLELFQRTVSQIPDSTARGLSGASSIVQLEPPLEERMRDLLCSRFPFSHVSKDLSREALLVTLPKEADYHWSSVLAQLFSNKVENLLSKDSQWQTLEQLVDSIDVSELGAWLCYCESESNPLCKDVVPVVLKMLFKEKYSVSNVTPVCLSEEIEKCRVSVIQNPSQRDAEIIFNRDKYKLRFLEELAPSPFLNCMFNLLQEKSFDDWPSKGQFIYELFRVLPLDLRMRAVEKLIESSDPKTNKTGSAFLNAMSANTPGEAYPFYYELVDLILDYPLQIESLFQCAFPDCSQNNEFFWLDKAVLMKTIGSGYS